MTKEGTIACLKASTYTQMEVRNLISQIDIKEKYKKPTYLRRGDIYIDRNNTNKPRPCVIIKVGKETVAAIPLTTTEDELMLIPSKSRFMEEGWFTKTLLIAKIEVALEYFGGVYDNPRALNQACKALKEYTNSIL